MSVASLRWCARLSTATRRDLTGVVCGFGLVSVFGMSQTDGEQIPERPCRMMTGDGPRRLEAALLMARGGYRVSKRHANSSADAQSST